MRVIVGDDSLIAREGVVRLLEASGVEVVDQADDGLGVIASVDRHRPDAAVIDIRMPPDHSTEGMAAATEVRRIAPDVGLLLLSQHVETHVAVELMTELRHGVGYLLKDRVSDLDAFAGDLRRVANGDCVIDPELVARLVAKQRQLDPLATLTGRERSVLALMAQGRSNLAMSTELGLSAKTVEAHVRSIFTKLNLVPDASDHRRVLAVLAFLRS